MGSAAQGMQRAALGVLLIVLARGPCHASSHNKCATITLNSSFYCAGVVTNVSVSSTLNIQHADELARLSVNDASIPSCNAFHSRELQCARFFSRCSPTDGSLQLLCAVRCIMTLQACEAYDALIARDFCESGTGIATPTADHCFSVPFDLDTVPVLQLLCEVVLVTAGLMVAVLLARQFNGEGDQPCRSENIPRFDCPRCCTPKLAAGHEQVSTEEIPLEVLSANLEPQDAVDAQECRICKDDESDQPLFAPCQCQGSMALVHSECLSQWIAAQYENEMQGSERDPMVCEVCTSRYKAELQRSIICDKEHLCASESMVQYASCLVIMLMLPLLILVLVRSCETSSVFNKGPMKDLEYTTYTSNLCTESSHWGVVAMGCLFLLLMLSSLHKAFSSWRLINERLTLKPI